jgi:hypothetical protein
MKSLILSFLGAVMILAAAGCASPNVNPPVARPGMGYVDFYCVDADGLYWDITDAKTGKRVFYDFNPFNEPILRVAFAPGHYQLNINVLNHVVNKTATVDVDVHEGKITPVTVSLWPAGTENVQTVTTIVGGTYFGRYGRNTHISSTESTSYDILAEARPQLPYQVKEQMSYFHRPDEK